MPNVAAEKLEGMTEEDWGGGGGANSKNAMLLYTEPSDRRAPKRLQNRKHLHYGVAYNARKSVFFFFFFFFFFLFIYLFIYLFFIARRIQVTLHCITVTKITYNHNSHYLTTSLTLHYLHKGTT